VTTFSFLRFVFFALLVGYQLAFLFCLRAFRQGDLWV
jgi:hypothetical protein